MNEIAINLGFIQIHWYSIFIIIAVIVAGKIILNEIKTYNIEEDFMMNLFIGLLVSALIGARLYFVIFNMGYYIKNLPEILNISAGGLAIHGGIIFGAAWTIYYSLKQKKNLFKIIDIMSLGLIIGQAIGRWGNFFNQEAFGPKTTFAFLKALKLPNFIIEGMYINQNYHHPTFLYESLWCFLGFIIMYLLYKKLYKKLKETNLTSFYLIWYSMGRFLIESLRTDSLMLAKFKIAQIVSLLMIVAGVYLFITSKKKLYLKNKVINR